MATAVMMPRTDFWPSTPASPIDSRTDVRRSGPGSAHLYMYGLRRREGLSYKVAGHRSEGCREPESQPVTHRRQEADLRVLQEEFAEEIGIGQSVGARRLHCEK